MSSLQSIGKYARAAALLVAAATLPPSDASGQPGRTWAGFVGDWNDPTNWLENSVPIASSSVKIDNGGTAQLSQSGVARVLFVGLSDSGALELLPGGELTVLDEVFIGHSGDAIGEVSVDGATFTTSGRLTVGDFATGTLDIKNGAMVSTNSDSSISRLSQFPGSMGTVNIAGGSTWTNSTIHVGIQGTGILNISGGSIVESSLSELNWIGITPTSSGEVTVSGTNSRWVNHALLIAFNTTTGTLDITGGAVVESTGDTSSIGLLPDSSGVVTVDGSDSRWTNHSLTIADQGTGRLNITGGGVVESTGGDSTIGFDSGATGTVVVNGEGSMWTNSNSLDVGTVLGGSGSLDIINGGTVTVGEALWVAEKGSVTVSSDSRLIVSDDDTSSLPVDPGIYVGSSTGDAALEISNGKFKGGVSGKAFIGFNENTTGRVSVTGDFGTFDTSSSFLPSSLIVGGAGAGELEILNGAFAFSDSAVVGDSVSLTSTGVGTVTVSGLNSVGGRGSHWETSELVVGNFGDGTLHIESGGLVESFSDVDIGKNLSASGEGIVTVDGNGSELRAGGDLTVADRGTGTLRITNGGRVESKVGVIGLQEFSKGTVTVEEATWRIEENLFVGLVGQGQLIILGGGSVLAQGETIVGPGGALVGNGSLITQKLHNFGFVAPGTSPGTLTIDGNYTQGDTGRLQIELASTSSYDVLDVTGQVDLDGTLEIILLDGFMPSATDTFDILTAASLSGAFSEIVVSSTSGGTGSFNIAFSPAGIMLSDFEPATGVPGDHNGDDHVDAADYVVWRKGFGTIFDQSHYTAWRNNFGASGSPGSSSSVPVPEPRSLLLLTAAAAAILLRRNPSLRV